MTFDRADEAIAAGAARPVALSNALKNF